MKIGIYGTGTTTRKNVYANLDDVVRADGDIEIVAPKSKGGFTDPVRFALDWAIDHNQASTFFIPEHLDAADDLDDYSTVPTTAVAGEEIDYLSSGVDKVFYAFNEDEESGSEAEVEALLVAGQKVFDLTDGLFELTTDSPIEPAKAPLAAVPDATPAGALETEEAPLETFIDEAQVVRQAPKKATKKAPTKVADTPAEVPQALVEEIVKQVLETLVKRLQTLV